MTVKQKSFFWIFTIGFIVTFLVMVHTILLPFVVGLLMAYFLDPAADKLESKGFSRTLATGTIILGFLGVIIAACIWIVPLAYAQLVQLGDVLPGYILQLKREYLPMLAPYLEHMGFTDHATTERASEGTPLPPMVVDYGGKILKGILMSSIALINLISLIIISPIVSFYMLRDWDRITAKLYSYIPRAQYQTIHGLLSEIDTTLSGFVRGYTNVILFLAFFYAGGLTLAGLNYGLVIGLLTGILTFIPYLGLTIGMAVGLTVAYFQFGLETEFFAILGVFVLGQFIEGNFITPKLVGEKVGLHPVWIIFALLAGGALFGFTGILLAIPIAASLGVFVRYGLRRYKQSLLYHNGAVLEPPAKAKRTIKSRRKARTANM